MLQLARLHGVPSCCGVPVQAPFESHISVTRQGSPVEQDAPAAAMVSTQLPFAGSQADSRHAAEGVHDLSAPTHAPLWQVGLCWH